MEEPVAHQAHADLLLNFINVETYQIRAQRQA
jgi:hypothetical protein